MSNRFPDGHWTAMATSHDAFGRFYTGKVVAYLPGNQGRAMRCRIRSNRPEGGFLQGAAGECQVSDGGSVDLDF